LGCMCLRRHCLEMRLVSIHARSQQQHCLRASSCLRDVTGSIQLHQNAPSHYAQGSS
jgi:hypothetical protein